MKYMKKIKTMRNHNYLKVIHKLKYSKKQIKIIKWINLNKI